MYSSAVTTVIFPKSTWLRKQLQTQSWRKMFHYFHSRTKEQVHGAKRNENLLFIESLT